jgi:hypothetical protein
MFNASGSVRYTGGGIIGFTALIYVEIKAVSSGESLGALLWVM